MENAHLLTPVETLASLRNGQPTPALMLSLSSKADRAITHLLKEFEREAKVIKVLIGDPGDGKTTFKTALFSRINEVPRAIPIKINLNASLRFKPTDFMVSLILSPELLVKAALALRNIIEKDSVKGQEIIEWMKSKRAWHLFRFFSGWARKARATVTDELPVQLPINNIYEFHKSMQSWFIEPAGTKTELSRCYACAGGYIGRVPDAPKSFSDIFSVLEEFIDFYSHLNIYPVWAIDEFESIALLQANGQSLLLSAIRELIDAICAPKGTGCLIIFTTNDGLSFVEKYPALSDRLSSSRKFTLPNIYWEINNFSIWDTEKALNILIELYELGAKEGDLTCQAVIEVLPLHLKTVWFSDYIRSTLASKIPARSRLKHVIVEIFDILSEGSFEDQCQYFARKNSSTSIFEKSLMSFSSPENVSDSVSISDFDSVSSNTPPFFTEGKTTDNIDDKPTVDLLFQVEAQKNQVEIVDNFIYSNPELSFSEKLKLEFASLKLASDELDEFLSPLLPLTVEEINETKTLENSPFIVEAQKDLKQLIEEWEKSTSPPTEKNNHFELHITSDDPGSFLSFPDATKNAIAITKPAEFEKDSIIVDTDTSDTEIAGIDSFNTENSNEDSNEDSNENSYGNFLDQVLPTELIQLEDVENTTVQKRDVDVKIIKYTFYKTTEKPQSALIELLKNNVKRLSSLSTVKNRVKKLSSLSTVGNRISHLRDIGRLDVLTNDIIEEIKTRASILTSIPLSFDDATEELTYIFTSSASKTRNGESKRNYIGLITAKRKVGVNFINDDAIESADYADYDESATSDEDILAAGDETGEDEVANINEVTEVVKLPEKFKEALFNPCYSLGAMRSFAYQFFLQRGHLPEDAIIDALILRIAKENFNYRIAPSRNGIKFIREKSGGFIDLFRQSEVLLSNAELVVSTSLVYEDHPLKAE